MSCRIGVERGGQFLPQYRAECGFQPGGDCQRVDHGRPALAVFHGQNFGQCLRLGGQPGSRRFGGRQRFPRGQKRRAGRQPGLLRLFQSGPSGCDGGVGGGGLGFGARQQGGVDLLRRQPCVLFPQTGVLLIRSAGALLRLLQHLGGGLGCGICGRRGLGRPVGGGFRDLDGFRSGLSLGFGAALAVVVAGIGLGQPRVFQRQPLFRRRRVALQLFGMGEILPQLAQPAGRVAQRRTGALFVGRDLLLRDPVAFQAGTGVRFLHPQRRQGVGRFGREPRCFRGGLRRHGGGGASGFQRGAGDDPRRFGSSTLDGQQFGIGLTQQIGDIAKAIGLPRLPLQRPQLLVQLRAGVVGARQIGLGGPQLDLGLAAAGVQSGDSRRFLQHHAPVFRPGADQRADPPLTDHGRGAGAGRQIGEQGLHVARPRILAVDAVGRTATTLQLAADRQRRLVAERGRRGAEGFLQQQRHFCGIAGFASCGAGEDDVVHLPAAQVAGAAFAHGPAQGLHDIGLAAAVRAHDTGQPGQDFDVCRLREAFEPGDAEAAETDRQSELLQASGISLRNASKPISPE